MKTIVYVHGASSTPLTFNYIRACLPAHDVIDFSYDSNDDIEEHASSLIDVIHDSGKDVTVVAHSLGGVIAMGASYLYKPQIMVPLKMVTISSPFAGSKIATYLKWLYPGYGLFDNVSVSNPLILEIQRRGAVEPTLNIVTTGGESPLIKEENDGVVSVNSQLSLAGCETKEYKLNHFEVLLSPLVVEEIRRFIWDVNENKTSE